MLVGQLMHKELVTILQTATVREAAIRMKGENVGSVLIVDEDMKLKGIVTDRDIAIAVGADGQDPESTFIDHIMTNEPEIVDVETDVDAALRLMRRKNIRRLPVVENGKLVGLLSTADVAGEIKEEFNNFLGLEEAFAKH